VVLIILLIPPLASYLRIPARKCQLPDDAWSKALCSPGTATTNPYSNCLEALQIQPSKMKLGDRYLQMNAYKVMLMENIQSHIIFTLINFVIPLTHTLLHFHFPESCPTDSAFSLGSTGLTNFQRACCLLIPSGWILSQLLILIYYYIDTGVQTCGLDFHFDNPNEDEDEEATSTNNLDDVPDHNLDDNTDVDEEASSACDLDFHFDNPLEDEEAASADNPDENPNDTADDTADDNTDDSPDDNRVDNPSDNPSENEVDKAIQLAVFSKLFEAKVEFKSTSGRWIHMEDEEGSNPIESAPGHQVEEEEEDDGSV